MGCIVNCLGYLCLILKIMALISSLVGLGIPYWYKGDTTETTGISGTVKTTIREGLWKKCTVLESTTSSSTFCQGNDVTTAITAIRWLVFVGAAVLGIAVLAAGAAHMVKNSTAYVVAAVHGFISVILHIVGAALYASVVKDEIGFEHKHLYIGWGLIVLCALLTVLSSVIALLQACFTRKQKIDNTDEDS